LKLVDLRNLFISFHLGISDLSERDCFHKERVSFGNLRKTQSQFSVDIEECLKATKQPWIVL